jgi:D-glycero-alpha-D-manno-heptose-7-phosphate kinase
MRLLRITAGSSPNFTVENPLFFAYSQAFGLGNSMHNYISVRAPLRISFFGGGTDYPEYFANHPAAVLGMAIKRYIYISALHRPAFAKHEFTISYSQLERVTNIHDIRHPAIRVALEEFQHTHPLDMSTLADLPAQTGLGSSGSFMVGLIHLLANLQGKRMSPMQVAQLAIDLERDRLKHVCGVQDQMHAAFGGFHYFDLSYGHAKAHPIYMDEARMAKFIGSLVLVFTGQTRSAPTILKEQVSATKAGTITEDLSRYYDMAREGLRIVQEAPENSFIRSFGELMHEGWQCKRRFSQSVSSGEIDELYELGLQRGAYGGKLCGAGGGGFILFVVPPEKRSSFISSFEPERILEVEMDTDGVIVLAATTPPIDASTKRAAA